MKREGLFTRACVGVADCIETEMESKVRDYVKLAIRGGFQLLPGSNNIGLTEAVDIALEKEATK